MAVLSVSADGGRSGWGGGGGDGGEGGYGGRGGFGGFGDGDDDGGRECQCSPRSCRRVTGSRIYGCPQTNAYLQCTGTVCSNLTCPASQVWNFTLNNCSACSDGYHVSYDNQRCVCNQGTTFNFTSMGCSKCPDSSTELTDNCTCPNGTVLDRPNNACKQCPANSSIMERQCRCTSPMIFNATSWACFTCPTAITTIDNDGDECKCNVRGQRFDIPTGTCVAGGGWGGRWGF